MLKRSAPIVVGLGAIAYVSAVTQRSSMGVASLVASDRFHTNAQQLASLAVVQIIAYAVMQVPVGLLLDRFGSRRLLAFGALAMGVGQYVVAFSSVLPEAALGRFLVGFGDAFTFISMIRLINGWYHGRRASQLQQWLGNAGQLGQVVSAMPFVFLLHLSGWQKAFTVWATIALIIGVVSFLVIRDEPNPESVHRPASLKESFALLRESVGFASTRMAFWTHFSTQSTVTVLVLLWGVPFLEEGEGLPKNLALAMLSSTVFIGVGAGICYGFICSHFPQFRRLTILSVVLLMLGSWAFLLSWPGHAPAWAIWITIVCTAIASPSSVIAFDYSRQYIPKRQLGASNGFINIGGFVASLTMMYLVGLFLDLHHGLVAGTGEALYSIDGFRISFCCIFAVVGFGLWRYAVNEAATTE
jgi:MFS family permease